MNGFSGEFFGTMILILIGCGCSASVNLKRNYATGSGWWFVCASWGLAVTMGVYVAGFLGSQGHLNPAVTIPFAVFGLFPWHQVLPYLAGQFLGAFAGAALVVVQYHPQFAVTKPDAGNSVGIFATRPAIKAPLFNFLSEVIATFAFIFILLNLGNFTVGIKPFIVGLVITVIGTGLGSTTGFALNPARDWSPRFAYTILPVPNKAAAEWSYAWVPMCGPLAGGLLACALESMVA
ncbi:MIP/aquaporin family protein [Limosilactobacillus antri]|uniref:MIP/aquaporin family protein n=1 Tax=Limosilactobacillus antri TaxID=227943 RepID=UPI001F55FABA|nr:MIP/aquaporin family protein [Limosilactobacillus antri]